MVRWISLTVLIVVATIVCRVPGSAAFERFDLIATDELKTMLDQRTNERDDFILINTLDELIYRDQSIPGSINIPWSQIAERHGELGTDKSRLIVTYCVGYR